MNGAVLSAAVGILAALVAAVAMELWAALLHGRIWHHVLWGVHRSHHTPRIGRFERNDALSMLHAPIAIALILWGAQGPGPWRAAALGFGVGMSVFGLGYLLVHDGLVHERLPVARLRRVRWLARIRAAHIVHHRLGDAPFGLFLGPAELARARARRGRGAERNAPGDTAVPMPHQRPPTAARTSPDAQRAVVRAPRRPGTSR